MVLIQSIKTIVEAQNSMRILLFNPHLIVQRTCRLWVFESLKMFSLEKKVLILNFVKLGCHTIRIKCLSFILCKKLDQENWDYYRIPIWLFENLTMNQREARHKSVWELKFPWKTWDLNFVFQFFSNKKCAINPYLIKKLKSYNSTLLFFYAWDLTLWLGKQGSL